MIKKMIFAPGIMVCMCVCVCSVFPADEGVTITPDQSTANVTSVTPTEEPVATVVTPPVLTKDDVAAFVEKALLYAQTNGKEKALKEFMNKDGEFIQGPLYIYAYDFTGTVLSHGGQPKLVGKNLIGMQDANKVKVIQELIKIAQQGGGWLEYLWPNPEHGNKVERKFGYVKKVDDTWFLGSGIYASKQSNVTRSKVQEKAIHTAVLQEPLPKSEKQ
jgi:cytochrome c